MYINCNYNFYSLKLINLINLSFIIIFLNTVPVFALENSYNQGKTNSYKTHKIYFPKIIYLSQANDAVDELKKMLDDAKPNKAQDKPTKTNTIRPHGKQDPHSELTAERLVKVALQHLNEGRMPQAMQTLNDGIYKYPNDANLLKVRASILLQNNKISEALKDLEIAIQIDPDDPLSYVNRAIAYLRFKQNEKAMQDLDLAINLNPDLNAALFNRAVLYFNEGKFEKAEKDLAHALSIYHHIPALHFNYSMVMEALNNKVKAIEYMQTFISLTKDEASKEIAYDKLKEWGETPLENAKK